MTHKCAILAAFRGSSRSFGIYVHPRGENLIVLFTFPVHVETHKFDEKSGRFQVATGTINEIAWKRNGRARADAVNVPDSVKSPHRVDLADSRSRLNAKTRNKTINGANRRNGGFGFELLHEDISP